MSDTKNDSKIGLKSVKDLLKERFFIPSYQRGYRWTKQQVKDLLGDINEFKPKNRKKRGKTEGGGTFYCLQPLVVQKMTPKEKKKNNLDSKKMWYEVIDGQQRLTTIFIILKHLGESRYHLSYETKKESDNRVGAEEFLEKLGNDESKDKSGTDIDLSHMYEAYEIVEDWFSAKNKEDKEDFFKKLLNRVQFIWYKTNEADPVEVFTRLNIGKIPLTNAELIKALFLNSSNFHKKSEHLKEDKEDKDRHFRLRQQEIASEWDQIEYTLQNEEFWLFIHNKGYKNPTRIDFIFNLICEKNKEKYGDPGSDEHQTFRYYYNLFRVANKKEDILNKEWNEVKKIFQTFKEWFDDLKLYHYIGYLITISDETRAEEVNYLLSLWDSSKNRKQFISTLKDEIKKRIKIPVKIGKKTEWRCDLSQQYEYDKCPSKRCSRPLLLLHNIQTVINQNKNSSKKYGEQVFYKFPFHIFKNESWDVEHIDSNTPNDLNKTEDQKWWLIAIHDTVNRNPEIAKGSEKAKKLIEDIKSFYKNPDKDEFESLKTRIEEEFLKGEETFSDPQKKNKIWNFVLLDSSTNRGYGNSIFSAKRRSIIGKDKGEKIKELPDSWDGKLEEVDADSSFVPPCTKYVFLKYYSPTSSNPNSWTEADAEEYKKNIFETLEEFDVIMGEDK